MSTPEHSQRVPVMVVSEYLKWHHHFGQKDGRKALEQALHHTSLSECLPPDTIYISHDDAREVVWIFEKLLPPVYLDNWLDDIKHLREYEDKNVRIIAAAAAAVRRARTKGESVIPPSPTHDHLK